MSYIHEAEARGGLLGLEPECGVEGASGAAGIDKELVHVLECVEAMGAAPAEDVDVEAVRLGEEQVGLGGDEREALEEADADGAVGDDLGQRQRGGLDVVAALDDLEVGRDGAQVVVGGLVGEVAQAERLANLAGREELLELREGGTPREYEYGACPWFGGQGGKRGDGPWLGSRELGRGCECPRGRGSRRPW